MFCHRLHYLPSPQYLKQISKWQPGLRIGDTPMNSISTSHCYCCQSRGNEGPRQGIPGGSPFIRDPLAAMRKTLLLLPYKTSREIQWQLPIACWGEKGQFCMTRKVHSWAPSTSASIPDSCPYHRQGRAT